MATAQQNLERFQEIANRGLQSRLDEDKRARFEEAVRRGLITLPNQPAPTQPAQPEQGGSPRMRRAARAARAANQQQPTQPKTVTQGGSPRMRMAAANQQKAEENLAALRAQAEQTGIPLARDLAEIGASPELNQLSVPSFLASAGSLFTFDDREIGNILAEQVGAEIVQDVEGNYLAKMPSGEYYAINKPGISGQDAGKIAANVGAFTPAGGAKTIAGQVAGGMATQGGIELGQQALGGEVNAGDVVLAGAAPVVLNQAGKLIKKIPGRNKQAESYLDEALNPEPPKRITQSTQGPEVENFTPRFERKKMGDIRQSIEEGTVDAVGFKLKNGRVVKDPIQRELAKKGINEKVLVAPNTMNAQDKHAATEMLDLAEKFIQGVKGSERSRPQSVIGKNAMKRFKHIAEYQDDARKRITLAVNTELKGTQVDITDLVDDYIDNLSVLKVGIDENGALDFSKSIMTGPTKPIKDAYRMVRDNSFDSADDLHRIKQSLSDLINFDNLATGPIDARMQSALKELRAGINDRLRGLSENYAKANDDFAKPAQVLKPFTKAMGKKFDPESDRVSNFVGQELRKTITNYNKANELITAIDDLDVLARELGGDFQDDIMSQVMLNSELERVFGTFAPGSAQGVIEKGAQVAADRMGVVGQMLKAGLNEARDRVSFKPPSKEKLELIKQLKQVINQ